MKIMGATNACLRSADVDHHEHGQALLGYPVLLDSRIQPAERLLKISDCIVEREKLPAVDLRNANARALAYRNDGVGKNPSNMRLDPALIDKPAQHLGRAMSAIGGMIMTRAVLPCTGTTAFLLWSSLAQGQSAMHNVDGWESLGRKPVFENLPCALSETQKIRVIIR